MNKDEAYVRVIFPCGTTFLIRTEQSGVLFDEAWRPIDEELAFYMLLIKSRKLMHQDICGHA